MSLALTKAGWTYAEFPYDFDSKKKPCKWAIFLHH
jgi:hypothetical protein